MTTDSITQRLHAQADQRLRAQLESIFSQLWELYNKTGDRNRGPESQEGHIPDLQDSSGHFNLVPTSSDKTIWWPALLRVAHEGAFRALQPGVRRKAVSDFLTQFEQVKTQLDQIQSSRPPEESA